MIFIKEENKQTQQSNQWEINKFNNYPCKEYEEYKLT